MPRLIAIAAIAALTAASMGGPWETLSAVVFAATVLATAK